MSSRTIEDDTAEAGRKIQAQLASRMIAEELGPLLDGACELARSTAGDRGFGVHIGGEGPTAMHRWNPTELLSLAIRSREVRALERIADNIARVIPYLEKLDECVCKLADCGCADAPKVSTSTPAAPPPSAGVDTSSVKAPAGADAPAGASTSTNPTTKPANG